MWWYIGIVSYKLNIEFAFQTEIEKRVPSREPSPQKKIITEETREKSVERMHKESVPPLAPEFTIPLHDATVQEGEKFTFQCNLIGQPIPEVIWYKDGISILNNPDYLTTYIHGICTLTIEETFAEDSAKYTCKAFNIAGSAETSATLTVKGDFAIFNISFFMRNWISILIWNNIEPLFLIFLKFIFLCNNLKFYLCNIMRKI